MSWPGPLQAYLAQQREIDAAISRVLAAGQYILGPEVAALEHEFAAYVGADAGVGVASGTDALVVALRSVGVEPGQRVATVSHTAVATVAAVEMMGAEPVLVDVLPGTMTMDPASLERTAADVGGVAAVLPVHLYGQPADLPAICAWAERAGAVVVEDCSQAHGATLDGRQVGTWGRAAAYSCYPTKNLAALGDAGLVVASAEVAEVARRVRQYGWQERYISERPGINSRLDPVQAAVLRIRLAQLDDSNAARRQVAAWYDAHLPACVPRPFVAPGAEHVYHQYVVLAPHRDRLLAALRVAGIPAAVLYPQPVHLQPAYAGRLRTDPRGLPVTERLRDELLCLPMHPLLTEAQVMAVCGLLAAEWARG